MLPTTPAAKASAPGQYLGYSLQTVRLCFHLLTCKDDSSVSIEHVDDVAVHGSDGSTLLEQTKSATSQNPVSNWAKDLWKTFSNWLEVIDSSAVDPEKTRFQLYVTPIRTGQRVQSLSDAKTDQHADQVITELKQALRKRSEPPASFEYLQQLLNTEPAKRRQLIRNFHFESSSNNPVEAIRALLSVTIPDAMVDVCCDYAIGSAKEEADNLIRQGLPALINAKQFRTKFRAFVGKHDLSRLLVSFVEPPTGHVVVQTLEEASPFVRQLNIVDMPYDDKLRAVSDFLQCSADKTLWAEKGLVVKESIVECDKDLIRQHFSIKGEIEDVHASLDPKSRGRVLYNRCTRVPGRLEGREVPSHFVPGSYNSLANRYEIGWHPEYRAKLGLEQE